MEELLQEQAAVAGMWVPYEQLNRGGLEAAQKSIRQQYEELTLARSYQPKVFPGMVQTEAYTRAALTGVIVEQAVETDDPDGEVARAVAERMDRQRLLGRPDARWFFLLEEPVLSYRPYSRDVHRWNRLWSLSETGEAATRRIRAALARLDGQDGV
ncbi:MAG: Scr1 family TA system antitoxin-like transcriptional regulator [Actinoallomurus sp.]